MSTLGDTVAKKIKQKRKDLGVTQRELALLLGSTVQLIQHYEKGTCQMPITMLNDLAILCKVPLDWFFLEDNELLVFCYPLNEAAATVGEVSL
jgi:transcriptional regulator with XRE-family HTH domain